MQALAEANVGEDYTIKWMFGVPEVLDLMAQCQIKEGVDIHIIQKFIGGLIIGTNQVRIAISLDSFYIVGVEIYSGFCYDKNDMRMIGENCGSMKCGTIRMESIAHDSL